MNQEYFSVKTQNETIIFMTEKNIYRFPIKAINEFFQKNESEYAVVAINRMDFLENIEKILYAANLTNSTSTGVCFNYDKSGLSIGYSECIGEFRPKYDLLLKLMYEIINLDLKEYNFRTLCFDSCTKSALQYLVIVLKTYKVQDIIIKIPLANAIDSIWAAKIEDKSGVYIDLISTQATVKINLEEEKECDN